MYIKEFCISIFLFLALLFNITSLFINPISTFQHEIEKMALQNLFQRGDIGA